MPSSSLTNLYVLPTIGLIVALPRARRDTIVACPTYLRDHGIYCHTIADFGDLLATQLPHELLTILWKEGIKVHTTTSIALIYVLKIILPSGFEIHTAIVVIFRSRPLENLPPQKAKILHDLLLTPTNTHKDQSLIIFRPVSAPRSGKAPEVRVRKDTLWGGLSIISLKLSNHKDRGA